MSNTLFTR